VCSIVACQDKEAVFTLAEAKRAPSNSEYKYYFSTDVLVENVPKDREKLQRLMIYHFLHIFSGIDTLQTYTDVSSFLCTFIKSTSKTRMYFIDKIGYRYGDVYTDDIIDNKTYIGTIVILRCKEDAKKMVVYVDVSLGKAIEYNPKDSYTEDHTLQNDCDPDWYEANKDNDIVKYYMELRNK